MKKFMSVLFALPLVSMLAGGGVLPQVPAPVLVSLNAPAEVLQGSNFTATVDISQVVDLNGAQYDISFDPLVLRLDDVAPGQIDSTEMPVQGFTEVSPGVYRVLQSLMFDKISGSGYLAVLHFQVIGSPGDNSTIDLSNGTLSGWVAEIPATWIDDSVNVVEVDTTPPTVIATLPTANATDVAIDTTIQVTFSESMNTSSVESAFSISPAGSGSFSWTGNVLTFVPGANLTYNTSYTVTIGTAARDLAGIPLAETYIWSFTTTVPPPELVSIAITPASSSIIMGQTQQFTATGNYTDASTANMTGAVTWASSNTSVATIDTAGLATSVAAGNTVITATSGNVTSPGVTLTVNPAALDNIVISTDTSTITNVDTATFTSAGFDAYSNSWDITANTTFSIEAGAGGSWIANVYTPETVGTWTVTGTHTPSGKTDNATLIVERPVDLVLVPAISTIGVEGTFDITVEVQAAAGVDGITITMDYDPAYLEFQSWTLPAINHFEVLLFDTTNITGEADYGRVTFGAAPSGTFDFVTMTFKALAVTANTSIDFHRVFPRATSVLVGIDEGLDTATGANVTITLGAAVDISVVLQGPSRPSEGWVIPITVEFFSPGANVMTAIPVYSFNQATVKSDGTATVNVIDIMAGTYDITVVSEHTLLNVQRNVVITAPSTAVDMGTLLEGDANSNGQVEILDFGLLKVSFMKIDGQAGYNAMADFDRNGQVSLLDFGLLKQNFMRFSPITVP